MNRKAYAHLMLTMKCKVSLNMVELALGDARKAWLELKMRYEVTTGQT